MSVLPDIGKQGSKQEPLDKINAAGDGIISYPSGNFAVVVCKTPVGQLITFFADNSSGTIICSFDHLGVGSVNYQNGKPWLVVTMEGYTVSDRKGNITERGTFPRQSPLGVRCEVNENLVVEFMDRQNITAQFSMDRVNRTFQVGEQLRRTTTHLDKVVASHKGKLELDVTKIRQQHAETGSLYVSKGPMHTQSDLPGIGHLKALLRNLSEDHLFSSTIADLDHTNKRLALVNTLPKVPYGTTRSLSSTLSASRALPDYGSPPLSETQRTFQRTMRSPNYSKSNYKGRRTKLPLLSMQDAVNKWISQEAEPGILCMMCVLSDWNPVCYRVEPHLQEGLNELKKQASANAAADAAYIKVFKVDASEGNTLQTRYHFRTVPMFLMFMDGKLLYASNAIRTKDEMLTAVFDSLTKGRKREYLPDNFKFFGRDNHVLNGINQHMSLLSGR